MPLCQYGTVQSGREDIDVTTLSNGWSVSGQIDALTAGLLTEAMQDLPDVADGPIEVDLADVTFMDSSGLRVLLGLADRAAQAGGTVVILNASKSVRRLLEITKLESTFGLDESAHDPPVE